MRRKRDKILKMKKASFLIFSVLLSSLFFTLAKPAKADVGDFSFCLHAVYNTFGKMNFGNREKNLSYVDKEIESLGGVDTIRNSGKTGIVPAYKTGSLKIDQNCIDQRPEEEKYLCRTADFEPVPHKGWNFIDGPINHATAMADLLIEVNLLDKVEDLKYKRTQANVDTMIDLVGQALDRYNSSGTKIKYWHTGNEPGVNRWTSEEKTDDGKILLGYATIKLAQTVRSKCPDCKIVLAGIGWDPGWKEYYREMFRYFQEVGYKDAFDAVDFHIHNDNIEEGNYTQIKNKVDGLKEILNEYGYQNKQIWITETSSWTGSPDKKDKNGNITFIYPFHSEKDQASELVKRYLYAFSQGVKKIFWGGIFDFVNYGGQANSYFSNVGLVYHNGEKKLSFETLRILIEKLNGFTNAERLPTQDPNLYSLKFSFNSGKQPIYVFWKEGGARSISLANRLDYAEHSQVKATNILEGTSKDINFDSFEVTSQPVFIESLSGYQELSCPSKTIGNLNCDKNAKVDSQDIEAFISSWSPNQEVESIADLDSDWLVNEKDLNILLKRWNP